MSVPSRLLIAFAWIDFLLAGAVAVDARPPDSAFSTRKALIAAEADAAARAGARVGSFTFDDELFAAAGEGYGDVRVTDDSGRETPRAIRVRRARRAVTRERDIPVRIRSLTPLPDNRILLEFERVAGPDGQPPRPAAALELVTGLRDFEKRVSVHGSEDGTDWTQLAEDQPIFDYSRFLDFRGLRVELATNAFARYRVEIANISESRAAPLRRVVRETLQGRLARELEDVSFRREDFRLESVRLVGPDPASVETEPVGQPVPVSGLRVEHSGDGAVTTVLFETGRRPVVGFALRAADRQFIRPLRVEGRAEGPGAHWTPILETTVRSLRIPGVPEAAPDIVFARPERHAQFRLTLTNGDNPPLAVEAVEVRGAVVEAVFAREPDRGYRVVYGARGLPVPRYDVAEALERAPEDAVFRYGLGPGEPNPGYRPPSRFAPGKTALVAAVCVMVAALLWIIRRAMAGL